MMAWSNFSSFTKFRKFVLNSPLPLGVELYNLHNNAKIFINFNLKSISIALYKYVSFFSRPLQLGVEVAVAPGEGGRRGRADQGPNRVELAARAREESKSHMEVLAAINKNSK